MTPSACPLCDATETASVGPILHPADASIAGTPIDLGEHQYVLARCPRCEFQFKWPPIDERALQACYEAASAEFWEETPDPRQRRFDDLKALIAEWRPSGRLLDVGCYNGALQAYLGAAWQHFGVEPSHAAAAMAESRGVTVLGPSVAAIADDIEPFDVVVAVDLIEHVTAPKPLTERLAALLAPHGILVYVTGDTDAWSWRLAGSRYWYCSLPEHVSFFNERSMQQLAQSAGLVSVDHRRTSHLRARADKRVRKAVKNTLTTLLQRTPALRVLARSDKPPHWATASDHMFHVMRRPGV